MPPDVDDLLDELLSKIRGVFGRRLVGLYLFGSLVAGGFDDASDVDLLAAVADDVDDAELEALRAMHDGIARGRPQWEDRIEIAYLSVTALRTFRERSSRIAIISPGEPLHVLDAGRDWLMNWWQVLESDAPLFGPPPRELIAPISKAEFIEAVRVHMVDSGGRWMAQLHGRKSQAYAILTISRGLYAHRFGEHVSKQEAAAWAQQALPEWADLIGDALAWRREADGAGDATRADAMRFTGVVRDLCATPAGDERLMRGQQ